jgi:hypothetical protein
VFFNPESGELKEISASITYNHWARPEIDRERNSPEPPVRGAYQMFIQIFLKSLFVSNSPCPKKVSDLKSYLTAERSLLTSILISVKQCTFRDALF